MCFIKQAICEFKEVFSTQKQKLKKMVTIINYKERVTKEGESFFVLELQSGVQMVKSKQTGKFYVTAKRATIPSTFNEAICKSLIGNKMPGTIEQVKTEPYEYTIKETGEVIELDYRYEYQEENQMLDHGRSSIERSESTIDDFLQIRNNESFSMNGVE